MIGVGVDIVGNGLYDHSEAIGRQQEGRDEKGEADWQSLCDLSPFFLIYHSFSV